MSWEKKKKRKIRTKCKPRGRQSCVIKSPSRDSIWSGSFFFFSFFSHDVAWLSRPCGLNLVRILLFFSFFFHEDAWLCRPRGLNLVRILLFFFLFFSYYIAWLSRLRALNWSESFFFFPLFFMRMRGPEKKGKEKERSGPNVGSEVPQCHEKKRRIRTKFKPRGRQGCVTRLYWMVRSYSLFSKPKRQF